MSAVQTFTFSRNRTLLGGGSSLGIDLNADREPDVALALANDTPFPDREIRLGSLTVSAHGAHDIAFATGPGSGQVAFSADASASAGLGIYLDPQRVLDELAFQNGDKLGLAFEDAPDAIYLLLRWGYSLSGTATGNVALNAGAAISFGAEGSRTGGYGVVRRFPNDVGARHAVSETVDSWIIPSQVQSIDALDPGTWILAEVDGKIGLSLGAQLGYDFNWVYQAKLGGLAGDIGLRLQLGAAVALGFQAESDYGIVVSRESSDPAALRLRLRLYKLGRQGWSFSFNGGVSVEGNTGAFLPGEFDDFVAAVFGVHGAQVARDLALVEKWTDPTMSLPVALSELTSDAVLKTLGRVTGVDPTTAFHDAQARLSAFLAQWDQLEHRVATALLKLTQEHLAGPGVLADVKAIAGDIATIDQDGLAKLFGDRLGDIHFFETPVGRWIQSAVEGQILSALGDNRVFRDLKKAATVTNRILDGGDLQQVLMNLQEYVDGLRDSLLHLDRLTSPDLFDDLDGWLTAKISALLGAHFDFSKVDEVRGAVQVLLTNADAFYKKALQALNRKYELTVNAAYQKTTSRTALLDLEFDFSADPAGVGAFLEKAIDGNFTDVLTQQQPGVSLNTAVLTHEVNRTEFVEVNLPFAGTRRIDHVNDASAEVQAIDDNGRILLYDLRAVDVVTERNRRDSRLAVGFQLESRLNEVRKHSINSLSYSYAFKQATPHARKSKLQYELRPYVQAYFPDTLDVTSVAGSFDLWLSSVDNVLGRKNQNGTHELGNALVSLDLSLPAAVATQWLAAPADAKSPVYMRVSRLLQAKLRQLIPFAYFQDPRRYSDLKTVEALVVYSALPVTTSIGTIGGQLRMNTNTDVYWDRSNLELRAFLLASTQAQTNLALRLMDIHSLLLETPGMSDAAPFYDPASQVDDFLRAVAVSPTASIQKSGAIILDSLLSVEQSIVRGAVAAGVRLARTLAEVDADPVRALGDLTSFGAAITDAFNNKTWSVYGGGAVRPFGAMLFAETAAAISGQSAGGVEADAMLELIVFENGTPFPPDGFPDFETPSSGDVALRQRLVHIGTRSS